MWVREPYTEKKESNCETKKLKSGHPLQKGHDTKTNWPTDRRSQCNLNLKFSHLSEGLRALPGNLLNWIYCFLDPTPNVVSLTTTPNFLFSLSLYKKQKDNAHESRGIKTERDCAGDAQQQLKSTDPTSRQRGRPASTNPQMSENTLRKKEKTLSRVPDGNLTPRQTGRLAVGRNITLSLTLALSWVSRPGGGFEYLHRSPASHRRRRKGKSVPGSITGPLLSWVIYE
jgi:hypothetical protein